MLEIERGPLEFELPTELEAHEPPEARGLARDQVRLLVSYVGDDRIEHVRFTDLPGVLRPGDLVVANDSATLPAAVTAWRDDGTQLNLHISTRLPAELWVVEPRRISACDGEVLRLPGGARCQLLARYPRSKRLWVAQFDTDVPTLMARFGRPIAYPYVRDQLAHRGIGFVTLTLHTGVASLEGHEKPYAEEYWVPELTASAVSAARADGRRVIAVGTTVVRALESAWEAGDGELVASHASTDPVIATERGVRVVDSLLTGFHEPKASHLAMLEAIAGRRHLETAYRAALDGGYLWHEFGDVHLIVSDRAR